MITSGILTSLLTDFIFSSLLPPTDNLFAFCFALLIEAMLLDLNSDSSSFNALDNVNLYSLFLPDSLLLTSLETSPLSLRVALCSANFLFSELLVIKLGLTGKFLSEIVLFFQ